MSFRIWDSPSGRSRRWSRRGRAYPRAPMFARMAVVLLAAVLLTTLGWQGAQRLLHPPQTAGAVTTGAPATPASNTSAPAMAAWQSQVIGQLEMATAEGSEGNISAAEVQVDRAAAILAATRIQGQPSVPDFFDVGLRSLDRVLHTQPENQRLFEHVTLAKIELAQLRSAQPVETEGSGDGGATDGQLRGNADAAIVRVPVGPGATAPHAVTIPGHVVVASPRTAVAQSILNPETVKGTYIDATLMPESAEIILPPATRLFVDDVRVEGLTFEGASQTLDGIHWKNVTFVNTRLRYEGGEVSLNNVRFVRCTFGISTDERGARLASAVALGQTSLVIE
jgi:hypothetical protein